VALLQVKKSILERNISQRISPQGVERAVAKENYHLNNPQDLEQEHPEASRIG
jgi:hypothetical protein